MEIQDHLDLIRAHSYSLIDLIKEHPDKKMASLECNVWCVLDNIVTIENSIPGDRNERAVREQNRR